MNICLTITLILYILLGTAIVPYITRRAAIVQCILLCILYHSTILVLYKPMYNAKDIYMPPSTILVQYILPSTALVLYIPPSFALVLYIPLYTA